MVKVLLIEDNPGDARLVAEQLKDVDSLLYSHAIHHVERVRDAVRLLSESHDFDIILSDISLPDSSGTETFATLTAAAADLPVLFMTGSNDEELAMAAIKQGAQDYLIKGRMSGDALAHAIQYAIERKKSQNEMNKALLEVQESKERVRSLAAQKKQLLTLNKAKDEFISLASHQLRTPATAVKQYVGMILQGYAGEVDHNQLKLLQTAYDSNERQLNIINDLLKTAQIDSSIYQLKVADCDIVQIVQNVLHDNEPTFRMRQQTVRLDGPSECVVRIDAAEMGLVVANVIENASKYTPVGKNIHITIHCSPKKLRLSVRDEGVGIGPEDQKRIFDKFTRVDNVLSDTVSGSGLGLYWARRIMRLHHGTIAVSSELEKGSTFTLCLPR